MKIDPRLKQWATPTQAKYIDAVNEHGSNRKAAKVLGVGPSSIDRSLNSLRRHAAKQGYAPEADMVHAVPEPFVVKGTSTLYDDDGNVKLQWVKSTLDQQKVEEAMRAAVAALAEDIERAPPKPPPRHTIAALCNLYTITDYHVGMRSWKPETGADWDLKIAEDTLVSAFTQLVDSSPKARIGFVNQLGDFLHFDALAPLTPTSGHQLDADGRYSHVVRTATRLLRFVVDLALRRHESVIVNIAEGNHDLASSVWLRHLFALLYEKEPRVTVLQGENPYYAYQHGKTMLAFHHGHLAKNDRLPLLFAARYPQMWGETSKRYVHVGHWHHVEEKEHAGMKVVQHATLAAADAYATRHGYLSEREITSVTYHEKFGQVARSTVCPEMLV